MSAGHDAALRRISDAMKAERHRIRGALGVAKLINQAAEAAAIQELEVIENASVLLADALDRSTDELYELSRELGELAAGEQPAQ